jgi:hypothetical protein
LKAIGDPGHPEHQDYLEWVGEDFDPEYFDLDEINAALQFTLAAHISAREGREMRPDDVR